MGADNLVSFHKWDRWQDMAKLMPIAVYVRPGATHSAPFAPAAQAMARWRVDESDAAHFADLPPPRLDLFAWHHV